MSDSFKKRSSNEGTKFKSGSEVQFKIEAKRNKMLGYWAAEKLGISGDEAESYAKKVVVADLEEAGYEDVVRHVSQSFRDGGVEISDDEIRSEIRRLEPVAEEEIRKDYSEPLGSDHDRVGG